jgi:excisionase family DNA binding protein
VNFAEALRQAAQNAGTVLATHPNHENGHHVDNGHFEAMTMNNGSSDKPQLDLVDGKAKKVAKQKARVVKIQPENEVAFDALTAEPVSVPITPSIPATAGNVVRLELFLTPEQLNGLFRAVCANQHTVMTLREASSYLRVNPSRLEEMAQESEIPAFLIDGKWRFPRNSVDEWLNMQSFRKEMEA